MGTNKKKETDKRYRLAHKDKVDAYQKLYRAAHKEKTKAYNSAYRATHEDKRDRREEQKAYKAKNRVRIKEQAREYHIINKEHGREVKKKWWAANPGYSREYYRKNRERILAVAKIWRDKNPDKVKTTIKKYYQTPKGRVSIHKNHNARRSLGFIPINKPFLGCEAHHVDKERVIYIPKKLHQSIRHSVLSGKNMDKINALAFGFMLSNPQGKI